MNYSKAVRKGAALLTKRFGKGWEKGIDLSTFDVSEPDCCVIGQTFSGFNVGLEDLGMLDEPENVKAHGFEAPRSSTFSDRYDGLQKAWISYLEKESK
jgi:hypothetical protein